MITKQCTNCKEIKEIKEFYKSANTKDGFRHNCRKCVNKYNMERGQIPEVKEARRKSVNKYFSTKKGKEKRAFHFKKWKNSPEGKIAYALGVEKYENTAERKLQHKIFHKKYIKTLKGRALNCFNKAKRDSAKKLRTPKWLTKQQFLEIRTFYDKSAILTEDTGIKHNVDHIIPLQGENVSGLHVPWNLQVLTASENFSKKNKFRS